MKEKLETLAAWRLVHSPKKHTGTHSVWYMNTHPEKFKQFH